jgi:hypothetical protein
MTNITTAANDLTAAFDKFISAVAASAGNGKTVEPDVDTSTGQVTLDRDEVESLKIVDLRSLAKSHGIDVKVKKDILAAFEEKGFFSDAEDEDEEEPEDDDEADDDDEEEEEEDEGLTRDDLEEKTLSELKKIAKAEGHEASALKGLDQDGLIDLILGEDDDDDEDEEEEDEDDEEADDDDDEEEVEIDKETLEAMSDAELKEIVKSFSLKVPKKANRKTIIQTILDAAEEAEDDE